MNAMGTEPLPLPLPRVTFYVHGFGLQTLPPLHMLEDAGPRVLAGDYGSVLMEDEVPIELVERLQDTSPSEAARFFFMWVIAGFDFEAAHWSQTLSLYRALPCLALVAPGHEEDDDWPEPSLELAEATVLYDVVEDIADAVLEHWGLH